jgi:hypothetical protein
VKEKNKKVASGAAVFLFFQWEQFLCSAEMQQTLIFWPLHPLVQHIVAMICPVRVCAAEDGRYGRPNSRRERVRWYSCCYPSLWRYGRHCGEMTRVMLGQSVVPALLLTVHGHVCLIGGSGCRGGGGVASRLARGLHVSLGQGGSTPRGSDAPVLLLPRSGEAEVIPDRAQGSGALTTSWGLGRGGNFCPRRLSRPRPLRKARADED